MMSEYRKVKRLQVPQKLTAIDARNFIKVIAKQPPFIYIRIYVTPTRPAFIPISKTKALDLMKGLNSDEKVLAYIDSDGDLIFENHILWGLHSG